ncbi:hypothetical protein EV356DRAFT_491381 [Viridothelium virens]|uniref:Zn(2)-C6 fungal-type domain-containing protein n=1 Tax=Viridothelium virens TaxID=1048519 RepID=A0A6A6GYF4_VIRVR|nr:hypothetical protein EV356DRAFT_491381 [Viridothelium virens]
MLKSTDRIGRRNDRVRKRAPNACVRCRKQKIKCSGTVPCEQCKKRSVLCDFDARQQKVLVTQSYIADLEERAARPRRGSTDEDQETGPDDEEGHHEQDHGLSRPTTPQVTPPNDSGINIDVSRSPHSDIDQVHQNGLHSAPAADLRNPLDPVNSDAFTVNNGSKPYFLGVSSNWSFGRRVLRMVHSKTSEAPLSTAALLFEGSTYDLGWDGQRTSANVDSSVLPAADFAIYLIDAVKFHCGHLFHMFDETTFMHHFHKFYDEPSNQRTYPRLWYIHFLIILAFGKGFLVRAKNEKRPPGSELFVQAMKLLPDISYMYSDTVQSIELLCCAALYLQCLDNRSAAYNMIGQALRMAVEQGMHTDMRSLHLSESLVERNRETWWTVYVLDRQMTALMGVPMSLSDDDITAPLPSFAGSLAKQKALDIHIKLARANAAILQTVYGKTGGRSERFLASMKEALRTIAEAKDELNLFYSLNLHQPAGGISRLWATLHLFHHQTLILATRPLLYSFLQKRLEATRSLRVSSSSDARSLIRVCVSSAQQSLKLLETLQSQSLLGNFVPFDREATFSSSVVLSVAATVDPSLVKDRDSRLMTASSILDEMVSCGNRIADFQRRELDQLDFSLRRLQEFSSPAISNHQVQHENSDSVPSYSMAAADVQMDGRDQAMSHVDIGRLLDEWNSEDSLNGEQLLAVVDSLDYDQFNWPGVGEFDAWT